MMHVLIELGFSLFDAILCVYFITRFNHASFSPKENRFFIPCTVVIALFSVINDLFLKGFNVVGTIIFLALYIGYALLIADKKYFKAIFSACIFEIVFVLLSSLLYFVISFIIKDYDSLFQSSEAIFRYIYLIIHKISLFVSLKIILMCFRSQTLIEARHGIIAFLFSFVTILGLGSTMYLASVTGGAETQVQTIIITLAFTFSNVALYILIYQMQKYQQEKYELDMLSEKIEFEKSRLSESSAIWQSIRQAQHDMKQHITVISGYIEQGDTDGCKAYLKELADVGGMGSLITSDNTVLDYLINSKLSPLKDTKIVISGSVGDLSDIKPSDLVCLIGNILDNALEALQRIRKVSEKRIELLFLRQNSNRIIICKNTIEGSVLQTNKELCTTKRSDASHGYGTKIIAKIVSDYHGMVDYFEEFNMFGVQVILPEPS